MFRVIWQYGPEVMGAIDALTVPTAADIRPMAAESIAGIPLVGAVEPVFPQHPVALRAALLTLPESVAYDPLNDLASYYHTFVATRSRAEALLRRLRHDARVVYAEMQEAWTLPVRFGNVNRVRSTLVHELITLFSPPTPDLSSEQGYLAAAPDGVDARYAWQLPGGRGRGVRVVDIEGGWNFAHEVLQKQQVGVIHGASAPLYGDHGTAVLGIYNGDNNAHGTVGIASEAWASAASPDYGCARRQWNVAATIYTVANRLDPGDVILLAMQAPGPHASGDGEQQGYIAVEYWQPEFVAITYATARGIYVVEAAGNGGEHLDHPAYDGRFSPACRDSGAIMVGAGASPHSPCPRSRLAWSNYGTRLDVQGWGEDIVTTGGRTNPWYYDLIDHQDPARCYTQSFGGTSGAAPIVAGVLACISGCLKAAGKPPLPPEDMRHLLVETGTPQQSAPDCPVTEHIGPLPDLRAALACLGF